MGNTHLPAVTTAQSQEADRKILDDLLQASNELQIAERNWLEIENERQAHPAVIKGITREANGFWHRDLMEKRKLVDSLKRVVLKISALPEDAECCEIERGTPVPTQSETVMARAIIALPTRPMAFGSAQCTLCGAVGTDQSLKTMLGHEEKCAYVTAISILGDREIVAGTPPMPMKQEQHP